MQSNPTRRRLLGALASGAAATVTPAFVRAQTAPVVRIGYAISKTGPFAGGANTSTLPNYQLWVKDVNAAGGLNLGGRRVPIEVIEYDDRSSSEECVRAVERLINQDKVDLVLPPWGTGLNLAVGPVLNRAGMPHLAVTSVTDRAPELAKRWTNAFFYLGTAEQCALGIVADVLRPLRENRHIGTTVAMVGSADQFGIELANAARRSLKEYGFNLLMDQQYPQGTQDVTPLISEAMRGNPDVFIAFSYPGETIALTDAARVRGFNPKVFYTAVGTAFPLFRQRFGANAEGVMGIGGWNPDASPAAREYFRRHTELVQREPDRWASPVTYASLQVLQQAIEKVGRIDRAALIREMHAGTFETILGPVRFKDGLREGVYTAGQWQDGEFVALAPRGAAGTKPPRVPKPAWKA